MLNKPAVCLLLWASVASAFGQTTINIQAKPGSSAYVQDARGVIVRGSLGLCWRSGYWTPADSVTGCDGDLAPPISKATAPAIVSTPMQSSQAPAAYASNAASTERCDFAVTLDNDQIFGFGKVILTAAAERRIDNAVLGRLKNCGKVDLITVTGHADRLGAVQYNQTLSERRAEAVAVYMKRRGVAAQIDTFGAGEKQPIKSCSAKLERKRLIECLAPNRRVAIEVRGLVK